MKPTYRTDAEIQDALRRGGGTIRGAWRALGHTSKPGTQFSRRCNRLRLPLVPIPDGFAVRQITTAVGADGTTTGQSIQARREVTPEHEIVPDGHAVVGVSTLIGPGGVQQQWIKTATDQDRTAAWLAAAEAALEPIRGRADPSPAPRTSDDRLTGYVIGDAHIGMLAWAPEAGANFDVSTAEALMVEAIDYLFSVAPDTREALIVNVGDLQHADSPSNETPEGRNRLDVDGRDQRVRRAVIRIVRYYLDKALEKHEIVHYINQPGNHDPYAAQWLGLLLEALYEREPRVVIDTSPAPWRVHQHGRNMIAVTHKPEQGEDIGHQMAALWPEVWGSTTHRVCLCGHVHHRSVIERPGFEVETFGILAPRDAWHAGRGYLAKRRMTAIVWDPEHGEDTRFTYHVSRARIA